MVAAHNPAGVESGDPPSPPVEPDALVGAARGLAWLSGGILLTVLLFIGAADIQVLRPWHAPSFLLGTAAGLYGLTFLRPADHLTPHGRRHRRQARRLLLLQAYFAPFIGWWQATPDNTYFFLHLLLFLISLSGLLLIVNRLAGDFGVVLADAGVVHEALLSQRLIQWLVLPLTLAWGAAGIALRADVLAAPGFLLALLPEGALPPWLHTALMAAVLMTVIAGWKCGQSCYRRLAGAGAPPVGPA